MPNNLKDLSLTKRRQVLNSPAVKELNIALYEFRKKVLNYLRNAASVDEAIQLATNATTELGTLCQNLSIDPANTATTVAAAKSASGEYAGARCTPPLVWDPVTESCV